VSLSKPFGLPHVALVGMMGCGKTTIGRLLAGYLDCPLLDLDTRLVAEQGTTIPEMFDLRGETWFRDAEAEVLGRSFATADASVISVGGGAVLREQNRLAMRQGAVVLWLRASVDTLLLRNGSGAGRPMLAGNPSERIRTLTAERAAIYADSAHLTIDVDDLTAPQSAECVRAAIRTLDPSHWAA
jgi:shikimate kinase